MLVLDIMRKTQVHFCNLQHTFNSNIHSSDECMSSFSYRKLEFLKMYKKNYAIDKDFPPKKSEVKHLF